MAKVTKDGFRDMVIESLFKRFGNSNMTKNDVIKYVSKESGEIDDFFRRYLDGDGKYDGLSDENFLKSVVSSCSYDLWMLY